VIFIWIGLRIRFTDVSTAMGSQLTCFCEDTDTCPVSNVTATNCDNGYVIQTDNDPICVKFGSGLQLTHLADGSDPNDLFFLSGEYLNVTINDGPLITYKLGGVSTLNNGTILRALVLWDDTNNSQRKECSSANVDHSSFQDGFHQFQQAQARIQHVCRTRPHLAFSSLQQRQVVIHISLVRTASSSTCLASPEPTTRCSWRRRSRSTCSWRSVGPRCAS
jgi:hypothetical protein